MSEPAHDPNASTGASTRVPNARSTSPSTSGTASNSVDSNTNRLRRTSSSTRGRARRTSSVCHQIVRISWTSSSTARRRAAAARGSSRRSSRSIRSAWWSSTERRVASVGCAVSTSSTCSERSASAAFTPGAVEQLGGLGERLALLLAGGVVLAPAADALALLGDVGELQLQRAGADVGLDLVVGEPAQAAHQRLARGLVAAAQLGGGAVDPGHAVGELAAVLLGEHGGEHAREQVGLAGDGGGGGHRRRLSQPASGNRGPREFLGQSSGSGDDARQADGGCGGGAGGDVGGAGRRAEPGLRRRAAAVGGGAEGAATCRRSGSRCSRAATGWRCASTPACAAGAPATTSSAARWARSTGAPSPRPRRAGCGSRAGGSTTPGRSPARPTARSRPARCGSRASAPRAAGRPRATASRPAASPRGVAAPAPAGAPRPAGGAAFGGLSTIQVADGLRGPVILKATSSGRRIAARWTALARCGRGPRAELVNFTPSMRDRRQGRLQPRRALRRPLHDALVRYRVRFAGRVSGEGATGTLRMRARVFTRSGGRLLTRCDTRTRRWTAGLLRTIAPAPGGSTPRRRRARRARPRRPSRPGPSPARGR